MADQEQLLAQVHDDYGVIRVVQMGAYRYLEFGEGVEQSCVFTADPSWLEYDYTRAMLLGALCHAQPENALFLGLGAGSLVQACLRHLPLEDVEAIELRPDVPRLAAQFLGLADDPRLFIRIGDALELLDSAESADVLFMDLYTDSGPAAAHLAWNFLQACQAKLSENGWLIINQWGTNDGKPLGAALLRGAFHHHYWECPLDEGNVVLIVPASMEQTLDLPALRQKVRALAPQLGYSLEPLLERLRVAS